MPEASSRVLIDRTMVRVDGRPFFAFGPRILLTAPARYGEVLQAVAQFGFTAVGSPPVSEGTIPMIEMFFDAAERFGLMVLLIADPRLGSHGGYMAERFRHRPSLLGYLLPSPRTPNQVLHYLAERDAIRALDLFHPIMTELPEDCWDARWLGSQDVHVPAVPVPMLSGGRIVAQTPGATARRLQEALLRGPTRPIFCTDLLAVVSDEERSLGLYDDDPAVAAHSRKRLEWFPYLASFAQTSRRDLLGPFPELLRLQVYDVLMSGGRGVFMEFYEGMLGAAPGTGSDRLLELSIIAQEIAVLKDFLAEGRPAEIEVDSGHPRLDCVAIQHGLETLLLLRMNGYEDEYFVDEAFLERTEISVLWRQPGEVTAWRLDFPTPRKLDIIRDQSGSIRLLAGELELTGAVLLTPGQQRADDLSAAMSLRLEKAATMALEAARIRLAKTVAIESELMALGVGMDNRDRLRAVEGRLEDAHQAIAAEDFAAAWSHSRVVCRYLRRLIKYQMAKALAMPVIDRSGTRLRNSYYTLPRFYRENQVETARAFADLT
ncbi:hypothetical protein GC173_17735 [bacterium]|nr:hypothetical protein [bacterium]